MQPVNVRAANRDSYALADNPAGTAFIGEIGCKVGLRTFVSNAILVGDSRTALTVAHFNFDSENKVAISTSSCRFRWSNPATGSRFKSRIELLATGGDHRVYSLTRAADWAVIRLAASPPAAKPIPIVAFSDLGEGAEIDLISHAMPNRQTKRSWSHASCGIEQLGLSKMLVSHHCATAPGSSGGALVTDVNGQTKLVAMHVGRTVESGIAIRIDGALAKTLAQFGEHNIAT